MDATAFWNVIGEYNAATTGLQIAFMIILIVSVILSYALKKGWIVKIALSAVNLFIAIGFFATFGTEPIQHYFALPQYTAVGLLFAYDAWKNKDERLRKPSITQWFFLALYILYPFASLACGHTYPQLVTYIMPCPVITISIALYAGYAKRNKLLTALLVVWALTGVKAIIFNAYEDLILFAAGFYAIALLYEDCKSLGFKTTDIEQTVNGIRFTPMKIKKQEKPHNCPQCPLRQRYDKNPKSLLGRFWRWHINFCPGWKAYFISLSEEEQGKIRAKYGFNKYNDK